MGFFDDLKDAFDDGADDAADVTTAAAGAAAAGAAAAADEVSDAFDELTGSAPDTPTPAPPDPGSLHLDARFGDGRFIPVVGPPDTVLEAPTFLDTPDLEVEVGDLDATLSFDPIRPGGSTAHGGVVIGGGDLGIDVEAPGVDVDADVITIATTDPMVTGLVPHVGGVGVGGSAVVDVQPDEAIAALPDPPDVGEMAVPDGDIVPIPDELPDAPPDADVVVPLPDDSPGNDYDNGDGDGNGTDSFTTAFNEQVDAADDLAESLDIFD
jgi:hypothetical protein